MASPNGSIVAREESPGAVAPDAAAVRRVLAGDAEAFALIVNRYHERCLTVAAGILGDPDDAEDAVQDAFVRAYRALGSYEERERFAPWLLRIVVNCCRTHAARRRRWTPLPDDDAGTEALIDEAAAGGAVDALEATARREELARAMARLGPEQREAVVLRFGQELSYEEMATVTGVGVSALKMRVQRACTRLRALLSEPSHA
jgi:RNA polymerase sigma-70 factor (ECF subfamily)